MHHFSFFFGMVGVDLKVIWLWGLAGWCQFRGFLDGRVRESAHDSRILAVVRMSLLRGQSGCCSLKRVCRLKDGRSGRSLGFGGKRGFIHGLSSK